MYIKKTKKKQKRKHHNIFRVQDHSQFQASPEGSWDIGPICFVEKYLFMYLGILFFWNSPFGFLVTCFYYFSDFLGDVLWNTECHTHNPVFKKHMGNKIFPHVLLEPDRVKGIYALGRWRWLFKQRHFTTVRSGFLTYMLMKLLREILLYGWDRKRCQIAIIESVS